MICHSKSFFRISEIYAELTLPTICDLNLELMHEHQNTQVRKFKC